MKHFLLSNFYAFNKLLIAFLLGLFLLTGISTVEAATVINYQGTLKNSSQTAVPDTTYTFTFKLYTQSSGGSPVWTETQSLSTQQGVFSANLGSVSAFSSNLFSSNPTLYLGITVNSDSEMTPRQRVGSSPYAFTADEISLSGIRAAAQTNTINNLNFAQNWNWNTLTTEDALAISSTTQTTGTLLSVSTNSNSLNSTKGILYVSNTGTSTNGTVARIQANSNSGSGLTLLANGSLGIGTTTPSGTFTIAGSRSLAAWGLNGSALNSNAATYTDSSTAASAVVTNAMVNSYGIPIIAAINTGVTATNAATLYIAGAPTAGTNMTLTNRAALVVASGNVGIGTSAPASALSVGSTSQFQVDSAGAIAASTGINTQKVNSSTASSNLAYIYHAITPSSAPNAAYNGLYAATAYNSSLYNSATVTGVTAVGQLFANGKANQTQGIIAQAVYSGNDTTTGGPNASLYGGRFFSSNSGTGYMGHIIGIKIDKNTNNGAVDISTGLYIQDQITNGTGTTGATSALHIEGMGVGNAITFSGNGGSSLNSKIYSTAVNKLEVAASAGLLLNSAGGNVGVGQSIPGYLLHVGSSTPSGIVARFQNSTGTCDINPTATALSCSSDETLKENIVSINESSLEKIKQLNPVTYSWKNDGNHTIQTGFIAQQVRNIFPNLVSEDKDTHLLSLNYMGLIPYMIKSIQEIATEITQLKESLLNRVVTKELCIADTAGGQTCITKSQLDILLNNVQQTSQPPVAPQEPTSEPEPADEGSKTLEEQPEPTQEKAPEQSILETAQTPESQESGN